MNDIQEPVQQDMKQYYVLGVVVLIAIAVAAFLLRPKNTTMTNTEPVAQEQAAPSPTPGPITRLGCDNQFYNQVIGFPKYYLSVEGGDVTGATRVDCTFTVKAGGKDIATAQATSPLTDKPQRGGSTFRCTSAALELTPRVPSTVTVQLKDDQGATASCTGAFVFPAP